MTERNGRERRDIGGAMPDAAVVSVEKVDRGRTAQKWLARLAPWLLAALVFVALLRRYDPAEVIAQMRAGAWAPMLPFPFAVPFVYVFLHGLSDTSIFRATLGPLRWRDVVRGRAGTAILMLLGYVFGHGAMGLWLARKTGAPARAVSGAVLYAMASDLAAVAMVTTAATWLGHADVPSGVRVAAVTLASIPIGLAVVGPALLAKTRAPFLAPWRDIPRALALGQMLARAVDIAIVVLMAWWAARAFGMAIPFAAFATYMPVILLVSSLPVSVGGFGAAQAAWLLFVPWARAEQILAFQLLWQIFFGLGIVARGVVFVRSVVREIRG